MRGACLLAVCCLLATGLPASPQSPPPQTAVVAADTEARCRPSHLLYPTERLVQGQVVTVLREEGDWLAIAPLRNSFSWIRRSDVQVEGARATVIKDQAEVRVGSRLVDQFPTCSQVRAAAGSLMTVLGPPRRSPIDGQEYLPVEPPPAEVRYIPRSAVQAAPASSPGLAAGRPAMSASPAHPAEESRPGPAPVASRSPVVAQPVSNPQPAQGAVPAAAGSAAGAWQPAGAAAASGTPLGPMGRSGIGWLYRTALPAMDHATVYGLQSPQGQVVLYATPLGGIDLEAYLHRQVELFGPMVYHPQLRRYYMRVTQVVPLQ